MASPDPSAQAGHILQVSATVPVTQAEGPGSRFALWVQGCSRLCPGCCNPEMISRKGGTSTSVEQLLSTILGTSGIEGVTLLGGEPFEQAAPLAVLARSVKAAGLSTVVFTGFTLEELKGGADPDHEALLAQTDLLIDGAFLQAEASRKRRWIGSDNQRVHFLTDRYRHLAPDRDGWPAGGDTVEIRISGGQVRVNGAPLDALRSALGATATDRSTRASERGSR